MLKVGRLERPCMQHMQFLTSASVNDMEADFHGHALMASCPPEFHSLQDPGQEWAVGTYDLPASDLVKLFQLSNRLQLEGELTPIAYVCSELCLGGLVELMRD